MYLRAGWYLVPGGLGWIQYIYGFHKYVRAGSKIMLMRILITQEGEGWICEYYIWTPPQCFKFDSLMNIVKNEEKSISNFDIWIKKGCWQFISNKLSAVPNGEK